jgi:hypothetical protein
MCVNEFCIHIQTGNKRRAPPVSELPAVMTISGRSAHVPDRARLAPSARSACRRPSAEGEGVRRDSRWRERDLERPLVDRIALTDQLVQARLRNDTLPSLVAVGSV